MQWNVSTQLSFDSIISRYISRLTRGGCEVTKLAPHSWILSRYLDNVQSRELSALGTFANESRQWEP